MDFTYWVTSFRKGLGYVAIVVSFFVLYTLILVHTGANIQSIAYLGFLYMLLLGVEVFYPIFKELLKGGKKKKNGR